ncbi:MAG TPA: hypothetical protein VK806_05465 [Bacteroidia bacterium]|nr:hypothetical protein [Bacteroidia bacterium]
MKNISHEKEILLNCIDSIYPQHAQVRWSIFKNEKEIVGVSFELGDYLYRFSGINKITYKEYSVDSIKIGKSTLHKFDSICPGDKEANWYYRSDDTLLEVVYDADLLLIFFDKQGNIVAKGRTIHLNSAPYGISRYLVENCSGYSTLNFVDKVTKSDNTIQYWVTPAKLNTFLTDLGYYRLVFDENGKIISQKYYGPPAK